MTYKSIYRAIRRGHLKINTPEIGASLLVRKTKKGKYADYPFYKHMTHDGEQERVLCAMVSNIASGKLKPRTIN